MKTARRVLIAIGALTIAYAAAGALADPDLKAGALLFLLGVLVAHDGILLPLAVGAGAVVGRFVPLRFRAAVQAALLASLAVTVVAFPLVLGRGRDPDNPSVLPLRYGLGLLATYAFIWTFAAAVGTLRTRHPDPSHRLSGAPVPARRRRRTSPAVRRRP